jgi:hypothetical protein
MLRLFWRSCRSKRTEGRHCSPEQLLAFRDGELGEKTSRKVGHHLERCSICRDEIQRIEIDIGHFAKVPTGVYPTAAELAQSLRRLQGAIRGWNAGHLPLNGLEPRKVFSRSGLEHRLAAELEIYLGHAATVSLLRRVGQSSSGPHTLVEAVQPLLTAFLGRQTASAIAGKILHLCETDRQFAGDCPGS